MNRDTYNYNIAIKCKNLKEWQDTSPNFMYGKLHPAPITPDIVLKLEKFSSKLCYHTNRDKCTICKNLGKLWWHWYAPNIIRCLIMIQKSSRRYLYSKSLFIRSEKLYIRLLFLKRLGEKNGIILPHEIERKILSFLKI